MSEVTDTELVERAQGGDEMAVGELYERYVEAIYRWHYWQTNRHKEAAEDLTQETFLEMARSLGSFKGKSSFKNWLYVIAKRRLSKWVRGKYRLWEVPLLETLADTSDWIDPKVQEQKIRQLEVILGSLEEREQRVLRLRYLDGLTAREVAAELDLTASNVKVIAHRALKKLQEHLDGNGGDTIPIRYEGITSI